MVVWLGTTSGLAGGGSSDIFQGGRLANPSELWFRDPSYFRVGELHEHYEMWQQIAGDQPNPQQLHILSWIRDQVSIF